MDEERMKLAILELEADGADHPGAEVDEHVAQALRVSAAERAAVHPKTNRGVFENLVDWAKARLTEHGLHETVGERDGQKVYRITPKGRDELALQQRKQELYARAYGRK
jgi:hypothetical protein